MDNQEKFTTRSSKLKEHRSNLQMYISYPVRFSTDNFFSSLVYFSYFVFLSFFLWNEKYIFWYTFDYAGGWMIKHFSPSRFSETRLLFFSLTFRRKFENFIQLERTMLNDKFKHNWNNTLFKPSTGKQPV